MQLAGYVVEVLFVIPARAAPTYFIWPYHLHETNQVVQYRFDKLSPTTALTSQRVNTQ